MHNSSLELMKILLDKFADKNAEYKLCYDIGSMDVNGTYKPMVQEKNYIYRGLDISPGKNVDIVIPTMGWNIKEKAPLVISGQCLEHVLYPWEWIKDVYNISSDIVIIIAPYMWDEHKHPIDCWRILPDGMKGLLEYAGFKVLDVGLRGRDCFGVGKHV